MSPPSQPGGIPPQNTQGQPTWISGTQQNQTLGFSGQSSPPPSVQQAVGNHMNIPQHNFSQVPQQKPGNPMSPQPQPNQNNILAPPPTLQSFPGTPVPPLDRTRFQGSYRHFCSTKKLAINEAALNIGGKQVDLHALHEEYLKLRATDRVSFLILDLNFVCSDRCDRLPPIFGTLSDRSLGLPSARRWRPTWLLARLPPSTSNSSISSTPFMSLLFFKSPRNGTHNKASRHLRTPPCPPNHPRQLGRPLARLINSHSRRDTLPHPHIRCNRSHKVLSWASLGTLPIPSIK